MIKSIKEYENKERIAIIVIGYNRLKGLKRLLVSLEDAHYDMSDIPLIISIDASGNRDLYDYVNTFEWKHGNKIVNIQKERLGLKAHIFQCMSMSKYFKGVILLEDDLFVSPFFYHYAKESLDYYGKEERIAGIAMYRNEYDGYHGLPIQFENNGLDVFAWQSVCSWGEIMNDRMWMSFSKWLNEFDDNFDKYDMSKSIKSWTRAWSKYVYAYMLDTNTYFIYPYQALTTNFNDTGGEHGGGNASIVQVSLLQGRKNYSFGEFESLVKYDVYCQNISIPKWLLIDSDDITIDFYGSKDYYKGHYVLTPFILPYKKIKGFSLCMRPWELNVKYNIEGNDFFLYKRDGGEVIAPPSRKFNLQLATYYLRGFNFYLLIKYVIYKIKRKLRIVK